MRAYNQIAEVYDQLFTDEFSQRENEAVLKMLKPYIPDRSKIIDIGCGTGLLLDLTGNLIRHTQYIGIDPSLKMLAKLLEKYPMFDSLYCAKYEDLNSSIFRPARERSLMVSLFGSPSYIKSPEVFCIPNHCQYYFLMFYRDTYHPRTYYLTGVEAEHEKYSLNFLQSVYDRVLPFGNYFIATNLPVEYEDLF